MQINRKFVDRQTVYRKEAGCGQTGRLWADRYAVCRHIGHVHTGRQLTGVKYTESEKICR
jgi:hypothetical protein